MLVVLAVGLMIWWAPWRPLIAAIRLPDGYEQYETADFQLLHPEAWQVREGADRQGNRYVEFNGPATENGAYSAQARVVTWPNFTYDIQGKLSQFRAASRESGYRILSEQAITLPNAVRAHRFEVEQRTKTPTGATVRLRGTQIFALTRKHALLDFVARSPEDERRPAGLTRVLDSFQAGAEKKGFLR
ncbi:hypothetical protein ACFVH6_17580 [Spirillospora sp. NPDC127200]